MRVIAATHQNLEQRVKEGAFREDLYHRLNVIRLRLPPLRERREDIAGLARAFLARSAHELGVEPKRLSDAAMERLLQCRFPGNVRQLENLCHWLTVMAPAQLIEPKDLPPELEADAAADVGVAPVDAPPIARSSDTAVGPSSVAPGHATAVSGHDAWLADLAREARRLLDAGVPEVWDQLSRQFEGQLIHVALENTRGRRIEAAHKLGIGRNTITRKIQELGLDTDPK